MSGASAIWLDGAPASALPLPDRGLEFGDGLFETLLLRAGQPLYLSLHLQRLQIGLARLRFPECLARIEQYLQQAAAATAERGWPWAVLRLTVTRGAGPRGYAPPQQVRPRVLLRTMKLQSDPLEMAAPASLALADIRYATQPALAGLKHLNRLEQVLAAAQAAAAGTDEALMLDQAGQVVSVASGNIFALRDGVLYTPPLHACGIAGTRRRLIMQQLAPACGLQVREEAVTVDQFAQCEEAFYSNSLVGLRPIGRCRERTWHSHAACQALFQRYREALP